MAVLTVDGLTRAYPRDGFALRGVSFTVPDGHFAAVIGPSGAGKTSLLRLVAGLDRADDGRVLIDGQDVTGVPASALERPFEVSADLPQAATTGVEAES